MSDEETKEALEFFTRFGGATVGSLEDLVFEWWWQFHPESRDKFPFTRPESHLPYYSEFIVTGLSVLPLLLGIAAEDDAKKKNDSKTAEVAKAVRQFGEGGTFYALPTLAHRAATRTAIVQKQAATSTSSTSSTVDTQPPRGVVVKL